MAGAGCYGAKQSPRAAVTGTVTLDNQPLTEGSITFIPTDGTTGETTGGQIKDGTYLIAQGVVIGKNRVEIHGRVKSGKQIPAVPPAPPGAMIEESIDVPAAYNTNSAVSVEVKSGSQNLDFPLKSK